MPKGIGYPEKDKKVNVREMTRKKEIGGKSSDKEKTEKHVVKK